MKKAYWQMHISILLWGFTGILGKLIQLSEGLLVWYRLLITSALLLVLLAYTGKLKAIPLRDMAKISGVGFIIGLHWIFFYGAIKYSNISITLSCFSSIALFTALLEPLLTRRRLQTEEILFGVLAIAGIYMIFAFQKLYATGIVLALISAMLGATFTILNQSFVKKYSAEVVTFYELGSGMVYITLILPLYLALFPSPSLLPTPGDWIYLIILSVFCTIIPFTLSLKALRHLSAFTLNLSVNLEPVYSIVLAIVLFGEDKLLNTGFYAGTLIILSSVVLHALYKYRKARIATLTNP
jgi:drug/metabolite transporter (DMT)-like permease